MLKREPDPVKSPSLSVSLSVNSNSPFSRKKIREKRKLDFDDEKPKARRLHTHQPCQLSRSSLHHYCADVLQSNYPDPYREDFFFAVIMSSVSEETGEKPASRIPLLASIVDGLKKTLEETTRMLAAERRQRRSDDEEALAALYKVQRKLNSVQNTLATAAAGAKRKKMPKPLTTNRKRPQLSDDNDDVEEDDGSDKLKRTKKIQTKKAAAATAVSPLVDGGAAVVVADGNALLFFSNLNARDDKLFVCPSFDVGPHVTVDRKNLRPVEFDTLADDKQQWYLRQLQADILKRFDANAASLFASSGSFMINTRQQLLQNPANAGALMQSFVDEQTNASPLLNAANNTALMLAASLHKQLSDERAEGWNEKFETSVKEMCARCRLKFNTMIRWRATVGNLMLKSPVIACMLPYFVAQNASAIKALLEDEATRDHLEHAFDTKMRGAASQVVPLPPTPLPREEDDDQLLLSFNESDGLVLDDIFHF